MKSDAGAAVATLDSHATTPKVVDEESCGRWRSDGQQRSASPARCLPVRTAGEASDDQLVAPSTAHFHGYVALDGACALRPTINDQLRVEGPVGVGTKWAQTRGYGRCRAGTQRHQMDVPSSPEKDEAPGQLAFSGL